MATTLKIFAIRDQRAEAFHNPLFFPTKGLALRSFTDAINTANTDFNKYPDDYTMFELGEFDDATGVITPHDIPKVVVNAKELLNSAE